MDHSCEQGTTTDRFDDGPLVNKPLREERPSTRWCLLLEIGVAVGLLEAALWTPGLPQVITGVVLLAWVAGSTIVSGWGARELGITAAGFRAEMFVVPAALALSGLMILTGEWAGTLHVLHGRHAPLWHAALYAVWALVQQFLAQSFIFVRFERYFRSGKRAVLATAAIFCLAHIPNAILTVVTLAMALVWSELFRRFRNIYPLAIAHAMLGLALAVSIPDWVTHHMRVGLAYWLG